MLASFQYFDVDGEGQREDSAVPFNRMQKFFQRISIPVPFRMTRQRLCQGNPVIQVEINNLRALRHSQRDRPRIARAHSSILSRIPLDGRRLGSYPYMRHIQGFPHLHGDMFENGKAVRRNSFFLASLLFLTAVLISEVAQFRTTLRS